MKTLMIFFNERNIAASQDVMETLNSVLPGVNAKYLENVPSKNSGTSFSPEIAEINHWYNDTTLPSGDLALSRKRKKVLSIFLLNLPASLWSMGNIIQNKNWFLGKSTAVRAWIYFFHFILHMKNTETWWLSFLTAIKLSDCYFYIFQNWKSGNWIFSEKLIQI